MIKLFCRRHKEGRWGKYVKERRETYLSHGMNVTRFWTVKEIRLDVVQSLSDGSDANQVSKEDTWHAIFHCKGYINSLNSI